MSDTPITDGEQLVHSVTGSRLQCVNVEFARKLERRLNRALESLRFIAGQGGKVLESEYGDISCDGSFCADQAQWALYSLEDMSK